MPLSFETRRVGDITVVTCRGRIVEGAESVALQQHVDDLLPFGWCSTSVVRTRSKQSP